MDFVSQRLIARVKVEKSEALREGGPNVIAPALAAPFSRRHESRPGPNNNAASAGASQDRRVQKRQNDENSPRQNSKRSRAEEEEEKSDTLPPWSQMKKEMKHRKAERKMAEEGTELYCIRRDAKAIWEELRRKDCSGDRKEHLTQALYNLCKDHLTAFVAKHDTSRVIETLMAAGTTQMRERVINCFRELPGLGFRQYSTHVIMKVLRHANIEQRKAIHEIYRPYFLELLAAPYGRELLDLVFDDIDRDQHRLSFLATALGCSHVFYRSEHPTTKFMTAKEWVTFEPQSYNETQTFMLFAINKLIYRVNPITMKSHAFHTLLRNFFDICTKEKKAEVLEVIKFDEHILDALKTKDGATLVLNIFWGSPAKDRKSMVKALKGKVVDNARHKYGYLALLGMLDTLDDTELAKKAILRELIENVSSLMTSAEGRKVIRYLVDPRHKSDFTPEVIELLEQGDVNPHSKKDMLARRLEIKKAVKDDLLDAVVKNAESWMRFGNTALVVTSILSKCEGPNLDLAIQEIIRIITRKQPFECIQNGGAFLMVKKLIGYDGKLVVVKEAPMLPDSPPKSAQRAHLNIKFVNLLIEAFTKKSIEDWLESPQGAALIFGILDSFSWSTSTQKNLYEKVNLCDYDKILSKEALSVRSKAGLLKWLHAHKSILESTTM